MGRRHPLRRRVSTVQAHIAKSIFNLRYTTLNGCTVVIALIRALLHEFQLETLERYRHEQW